MQMACKSLPQKYLKQSLLLGTWSNLMVQNLIIFAKEVTICIDFVGLSAGLLRKFFLLIFIKFLLERD